jgi:3-hydroxyisobutyrate dehydrogenase-like beta-hydroxyacid dehydrogenase
MAREMGADLPVSELASEFETELVARGHADDDMSALARVIRDRSGLPS